MFGDGVRVRSLGKVELNSLVFQVGGGEEFSHVTYVPPSFRYIYYVRRELEGACMYVGVHIYTHMFIYVCICICARMHNMDIL